METKLNYASRGKSTGADGRKSATTEDTKSSCGQITEKTSEVAILASNGKTDGSMYHNFQIRCKIL